MASKYINYDALRRKPTMLQPMLPETPSMPLLKRASRLYSKPTMLSQENLKAKVPFLPPLTLPDHSISLPVPITSKRAHGFVEIYAGVTSAGNREINEDRVVMVNTTLKPSGIPCSYFAIFDGFSGKKACNYLRDNLYKFIFSHSEIASNPGKAVQEAF